VRREGAGRPSATAKQPTLLADLESLVDPETRGDPMSPLRWTTKSLRKLAAALCEMGHKVGKTVVSDLLHDLGYSLQANRKTLEGSSHPDRDAQFKHIAETIGKALADGQPAISVDTKKKGVPQRHGRSSS
jgi:transposase